MPLFKIDKNKLQKIKAEELKKEKDLQSLIEANLETVLGVKFIATEFSTTHGGIIDTLGLDENGAPVVIEYKKRENQNIINQGLFYLAWLVDHRGDFEMVAQKKLGQTIKVDWSSPRLILIASSYNKFDVFAVSRISGNIELKRYIKYQDDILSLEDVQLPETSQARKQIARGIKEFTLDYHLNKVKDTKAVSRINQLREKIREIDDKIEEYYSREHIIFKSSVNFSAIYPQRKGFWVDIKLNRKTIGSKELDIRPHKDEVWTHIRVRPNDNLDTLLALAKRAYEDGL